jgi:crotonobetainyl-CoA:carnitine CoA-transferase CaiB-like acyl-CoA transferase
MHERKGDIKMTLPLERFRMLDLTRLVPGPMATWMLADLGMDVLKIEDVADRSAYRNQQAARQSRENFTVNQEAREKELRANAWDHTHRNKRSIAINLQKPKARRSFIGWSKRRMFFSVPFVSAFTSGWARTTRR